MLLVSLALAAAALPAAAQDATWLPNPSSADYNALADWGPNKGPAGNAPVSHDAALDFHDTGSAGSASVGNNNDHDLPFFDSCSAGSAIVTNRVMRFFGRSTAGSASFTSNSFWTTSARAAARPL